MSAPVLNQDGLLAILQPLTGLSATACTWGLRSQYQVSAIDFAHVSLRVRASAPRGVDQHIRTFDAGTGTFSVQQLGQRDVRITVLAETFAPSIDASEVLENIRTGLFDEDVISSFTGIGLAFQRCTATSDLPTSYDQLVVSAAGMDLYFGGFKLTDPKTIDWIETVNGGGPIPVNVTT